MGQEAASTRETFLFAGINGILCIGLLAENERVLSFPLKPLECVSLSTPSIFAGGFWSWGVPNTSSEFLGHLRKHHYYKRSCIESIHEAHDSEIHLFKGNGKWQVPRPQAGKRLFIHQVVIKANKKSQCCWYMSLSATACSGFFDWRVLCTLLIAFQHLPVL